MRERERGTVLLTAAIHCWARSLIETTICMCKDGFGEHAQPVCSAVPLLAIRSSLFLPLCCCCTRILSLVDHCCCCCCIGWCCCCCRCCYVDAEDAVVQSHLMGYGQYGRYVFQLFLLSMATSKQQAWHVYVATYEGRAVSWRRAASSHQVQQELQVHFHLVLFSFIQFY